MSKTHETEYHLFDVSWAKATQDTLRYKRKVDLQALRDLPFEARLVMAISRFFRRSWRRPVAVKYQVTTTEEGEIQSQREKLISESTRFIFASATKKQSIVSDEPLRILRMEYASACAGIRRSYACLNSALSASTSHEDRVTHDYENECKYDNQQWGVNCLHDEDPPEPPVLKRTDRDPPELVGNRSSKVELDWEQL